MKNVFRALSGDRSGRPGKAEPGRGTDAAQAGAVLPAERKITAAH